MNALKFVEIILLLRCQSIMNFSTVCWRQVNLQELWLQKAIEYDKLDKYLGYDNDKIRIQG